MSAQLPLTQDSLDTKKSKFRSPLRYPGGKQRAISRISQVLPAHFAEYREPMVGGGSVYFHVKGLGLSQKYWINDKFEELIQFWRVVQDSDKCPILQQRLHKLRNKLSTAELLRDYFLKSRKSVPQNEIDAAMQFFFFNRVTFSGTTKAGGFSSAASILRFTKSSIERLLPMPEALDQTTITNEDYKHVIEKPGNDVFLFLDPPYYSAQKLYGRNGSLHDFPHQELAELLKNTPHRFLITYDDCKQVRDLYRWANVGSQVRFEKWNLTYGMNNCNSSNTCKIGNELFISNY